MENKFPKGKIALYMLGAAGALILLIISISSFGWFVTSKTSQGNMTGLKATDIKFELASAGGDGKYDSYFTVNSGEEIVCAAEDNSQITLTATGGEHDEIKWLVSSQSNFGNYGDTPDDGIQPGSCGQLTFYVVARQDTDLNLTFALDTILYTDEAQPITETHKDNSAYVIPSDSTEAGFVKGHILFFEDYDDQTGIYSTRIDNGKFTYKQQNATAGTAYKVDIFWIWPDVIDQLIMKSGDDCFKNKEYQKIISDADTAEIKGIIAAYPKYFLADGDNEGLSEMLDNMSLSSKDINFNADYYNALNNRWNDADNMIGSRVRYIELQLTAEENSAGV